MEVAAGHGQNHSRPCVALLFAADSGVEVDAIDIAALDVHGVGSDKPSSKVASHNTASALASEKSG